MIRGISINDKFKPIFVKSKTTGGHYAFKTEKALKPFQNNMRECKSIKLIESAGFKSIIKPTFESGWNLTGSWEK